MLTHRPTPSKQFHTANGLLNETYHNEASRKRESSWRGVEIGQTSLYSDVQEFGYSHDVIEYSKSIGKLNTGNWSANNNAPCRKDWRVCFASGTLMELHETPIVLCWNVHCRSFYIHIWPNISLPLPHFTPSVSFSRSDIVMKIIRVQWTRLHSLQNSNWDPSNFLIWTSRGATSSLLVPGVMSSQVSMMYEAMQLHFQLGKSDWRFTAFRHKQSQLLLQRKKRYYLLTHSYSQPLM